MSAIITPMVSSVLPARKLRATSLGWYFISCATTTIFCVSSLLILLSSAFPFNTSETVPTETSTLSAIVFIETLFDLKNLNQLSDIFRAIHYIDNTLMAHPLQFGENVAEVLKTGCHLHHHSPMKLHLLSNLHLLPKKSDIRRVQV